MTAADFRACALRLPGAEEGTHHGVADFRVGGKIFATLAYEEQGCGVLLLTPSEQEGMVADAPDIFSAVPNGWGRNGATLVHLDAVKPDILESALRTAWLRRAPKKLLESKI